MAPTKLEVQLSSSRVGVHVRTLLFSLMGGSEFDSLSWHMDKSAGQKTKTSGGVPEVYFSARVLELKNIRQEKNMKQEEERVFAVQLQYCVNAGSDSETCISTCTGENECGLMSASYYACMHACMHTGAVLNCPPCGRPTSKRDVGQ